MRSKSAHEARGRVQDFHRSPESAYRRIAYADGVGNLDSDQLKEIEYAFLIGPITRGLECYLEEAEPSPVRYHRQPNDLTDSISANLAIRIKREFESDPHRLSVVELAKERAARFRIIEPQLARNIYPVNSLLIEAAASGTDALYNAAVANAVAIQKSGNYSKHQRAEFVKAIKRSTDLPLTWTMTALRWHEAIGNEVFQTALTGLELDTQTRNSGALVYDPQKDAARLAVPLEEWRTGSGPDSIIGAMTPEDERIGCPVSFDMMLTRRFYEHLVDRVEYHQSWPDQLTDPRLKLVSAEALSALGVKPPK